MHDRRKIGNGRAQTLSWVSAADHSRKNLLTSIAQAGDRGPEARAELFAIDVRTLPPKVGAAIAARPASLSERCERH